MAIQAKELSELHARLAKHMLGSLEQNEKAKELLEEFSEDLPTPVVMFLESCSQDNPALFTSIAKFLKDNQITVAPEASQELSKVQKMLAEKRKRLSSISTEAVNE